MKPGMIVYNNELQIKFEFRRYWSIFYRVMALWLRIFHENFYFSDIYWINIADIEMKPGMIVYNNELQIKFEFRRYWSIFYRVMALWLSHVSEVKFTAGDILVPFKGRHLVLFINRRLFSYCVGMDSCKTSPTASHWNMLIVDCRRT
jgi:uncharacterized protein (UPF0332 family)